MADTKRADFKEPCSDCGDSDNTCVMHHGPLVPKGEIGYFCEPCFQTRAEENKNKLEPRPLGTQTSVTQ